jgi:hypothetical protein
MLKFPDSINTAVAFSELMSWRGGSLLTDLAFVDESEVKLRLEGREEQDRVQGHLVARTFTITFSSNHVGVAYRIALTLLSYPITASQSTEISV